MSMLLAQAHPFGVTVKTYPAGMLPFDVKFGDAEMKLPTVLDTLLAALDVPADSMPYGDETWHQAHLAFVDFEDPQIKCRCVVPWDELATVIRYVLTNCRLTEQDPRHEFLRRLQELPCEGWRADDPRHAIRKLQFKIEMVADGLNETDPRHPYLRELEEAVVAE